MAANNLLPQKEKKPPLTHFLCLPLVSETSLPLLENSLAKFKHNLLSSRKSGGDHPSEWLPPLFPDSAIRPLGTVHLTLGVMRLTSPDRIHEAVKFLESLEIDEILQEVQSELALDTNESTTLGYGKPISVSLESLGTLPKPKAATVLYANPIDPTSRLHPFAVKIRQAFVDAGFIEQDFIKQRPKKHKIRKQISSSQNAANTNNGDINGTIVVAEAAEETIIQQRPKLRPLLLHATLVNTIYARGERSAHHSSHHGNKAKKGRRHVGPLTFDARDLLARYRNYYVDGTCMEEKEHLPADIIEQSSPEDDGDDGASRSSEEEAHPSRGVEQIQHTQETDMTRYPFIWANNVPIDRLCICEMGAKTLTEEDNHLAARLGQEYRVVAERKLFQ
ncbi:uncharacterized protein BHQ10_001831 [Talaromyces amestolkiae]|uniref:A-kinase anchor protein 7-like phosphoesterase domain-containing protein n=1 Tax=Talaromyces amestolkiae TaxID=1196081 RepID=A0A364KQJ9_TALAM|nr:uncharacterized protein BHQ10_001831 [Talaromyces amestolkiae]RAO65819.1 hypothetical protein BHQ10_001831 [Talaromyces amestolkiae]